ncbi:Lcl domain-containing protein [Pseudoalteromonas sp. T1lg23B]|uniref:Lcl domain-containing protein n=1 Tax=Pseudoalteromonas sp. T1lg23B TaxID=2077097 RepID=UPI000CF6C668|nr:DUF1566 domain-containing protein [Pseudoalteromonas sp. T1lg23B]
MFKKSILLCVIGALLTGCSSPEDEKSSGQDNTSNQDNNSNNESQPIPVASLISNSNFTEPKNGNAAFDMQVRLDASYNEELILNYSVTAITADNRDVKEVTDGKLTFPAGSKQANIEVTVFGDEFDENDETFQIELLPSNNIKLGKISKALVTIVDEDDTPTVRFKNYDGELAQAAEGSGRFVIPVELDTLSQRQVTIPFGISGLATLEQDFSYQPAINELVLPPETKSAFIELDLLPDSLPEGGETIIVTLQESQNAALPQDGKSYTILIPGDVSLNDTGIVSHFAGGNTYEETANSDYPKQDAQFGKDAGTHVDFDGVAAFSFTKLDHSGNPLPSNSDSWRCIKDNNTGLVWERKATAHELPEVRDEELKELLQGNPDLYEWANLNYNSANYRYTWYNPDDSANGGSVGTKGEQFVNMNTPISEMCAFPNDRQASYIGNTARECSTQAYVNAYNELAICGFKNWKLPTIEKLRSLSDYETGELDQRFFPNMASGTYLSSSASADGTGAVWCLNTQNNRVQLCNKQIYNHVMLVREENNEN